METERRRGGERGERARARATERGRQRDPIIRLFLRVSSMRESSGREISSVPKGRNFSSRAGAPRARTRLPHPFLRRAVDSSCCDVTIRGFVGSTLCRISNDRLEVVRGQCPKTMSSMERAKRTRVSARAKEEREAASCEAGDAIDRRDISASASRLSKSDLRRFRNGRRE